MFVPRPLTASFRGSDFSVFRTSLLDHVSTKSLEPIRPSPAVTGDAVRRRERISHHAREESASRMRRRTRRWAGRT
jgi:hypothetical protein